MLKNFAKDDIKIVIDGVTYEYFGIVTISSERISLESRVYTKENYTILVESSIEIKLNSTVIYNSKEFEIATLKSYKHHDDNKTYYKIVLL